MTRRRYENSDSLHYSMPVPKTLDGQKLMAAERRVNLANEKAYARAEREWEDAGADPATRPEKTFKPIQLWSRDMTAQQERDLWARWFAAHPEMDDLNQ